MVIPPVEDGEALATEEAATTELEAVVGLRMVAGNRPVDPKRSEVNPGTRAVDAITPGSSNPSLVVGAPVSTLGAVVGPLKAEVLGSVGAEDGHQSSDAKAGTRPVDPSTTPGSNVVESLLAGAVVEIILVVRVGVAVSSDDTGMSVVAAAVRESVLSDPLIPVVTMVAVTLVVPEEDERRVGSRMLERIFPDELPAVVESSPLPLNKSLQSRVAVVVD